MVRWLSVFLVSVLLAACGSSDEPDYSSPENTLVAIVKAMNAGDIDGLVSCYLASEESSIRELILPPDERKDDWTASSGGITKRGTFTVGTILYTQGDKLVDEETVAFVQLDGTWKASEEELISYFEKHGIAKD